MLIHGFFTCFSIISVKTLEGEVETTPAASARSTDPVAVPPIRASTGPKRRRKVDLVDVDGIHPCMVSSLWCRENEVKHVPRPRGRSIFDFNIF